MRLNPLASWPAWWQRTQTRLPDLSVAVGWLLALALTAWIAAGWFWQFTAPEPVVLATQQIADPQAAARAVTQRHLLGDGGVAGGGKNAAPRSFTLLGAMTAGGGRPGFAVLSEPGKAAVAVLEGEEISPGVTLAKVMADKVNILRNGQSETVELTARAAATTATPSPTTPVPARAEAGFAAASNPTPPAIPPRPANPNPSNP